MKNRIKRLMAFTMAANAMTSPLAAYTMAQTTELTLENYMGQVKGNNGAVKSAVLSTSAGELSSYDAALILAPTVFANVSYSADAKIQSISFFGYSAVNAMNASFGINQPTPFGLQAKLQYSLFTQVYQNTVVPPALQAFGGISTSYALATTSLELTQSLWSNGFGVSTRANRDILEAKGLAASYTASYQAKAALSQAEMVYWRLVLARKTMGVQTEALDRAKKIYDWNSRRARLQLGDQSDVLQAEALVQARELDLTSTRNEVRSASRQFNSQRSIDSDEVTEQLNDLDPATLESIRIPARAQFRDDVKIAQQQSRISIANSELSRQQANPTVDVFANFALNGQPSYSSGIFTGYTNLSDSIGPSFSFNRPTATVGIRLSIPMPYNFNILSGIREGLRQENVAAELLLDRKLFEQENSWKDLTQSFGEAKTRLSLSHRLETIQKSKLDNERIRLQRGRSTTYQVLLFEQDFLSAQLLRIRDQASILNIVAQMKLFGETL
jgi:outer membrane protein TolC